MYHPTFQQQLAVTVSLYASFEVPPLVFQFQWLGREDLHGEQQPEKGNTSLRYTPVFCISFIEWHSHILLIQMNNLNVLYMCWISGSWPFIHNPS